MTRLIALVSVLTLPANAQTLRTLHATSPPQGSPGVLVTMHENGREAVWPQERIAWMFWRTADRQENRHHPQPDQNAGVVVDLTPHGASVVGVELDPRIESVPAEQWGEFSARASGDVPPVADAIRVRRRESLVTFVRPPKDSSGSSPIATSKLAVHAEIRPLMDPTRPGFTGDMPLRIYIAGVSVTGQRVIATHLDSNTTTILTTRAGGFADLRIDRPGDYRIEFHRATPAAPNDPDPPISPKPNSASPIAAPADIDLVTGVLTFTVTEDQR